MHLETSMCMLQLTTKRNGCVYFVLLAIYTGIKAHEEKQNKAYTNTSYVNVMFFSHFNYIETKEEEERRIKKSSKWKEAKSQCVCMRLACFSSIQTKCTFILRLFRSFFFLSVSFPIFFLHFARSFIAQSSPNSWKNYLILWLLQPMRDQT